MVAHLDSVTSLAVDPNGLYLLSGSEFVNLDNFCMFQNKGYYGDDFDIGINVHVISLNS